MEDFYISEGRKHDEGMLADSGLLNNLQRFAISPTGQPMCIYGNPAYSLRVRLQTPFRPGRLTPQMQTYNDAMRELRISLNGFLATLSTLKFLDSMVSASRWLVSIFFERKAVPIQISRVILISYQNEKFSQLFISKIATCSPRLPIF